MVVVLHSCLVHRCRRTKHRGIATATASLGILICVALLEAGRPARIVSSGQYPDRVDVPVLFEPGARIIMTAIQDIPLRTITGETTTLGAYAGQVLLVVNVASKCGLTPQYDGLEKLHEQLRDQGFTVLGFPANDFAGQEPGTDEEIAEFCRSSFDVQFPLFSKISVLGPDRHPLYAELAGDEDVRWNFEKFLISRDGELAGRFAPPVAPDDEQLTNAIEREIAAERG